MSSEIITLKFRPQDFDEFIGQEQVTFTLKNSIKKGNIHHAYLFYGPRGIGKTSAARILAKMLNCVEGPTSKPCNKCINCQEITKGNSTDVIEIDGASNRGINEIRELQEGIRYAPLKSKYKIYIIDEVHMLTKEAFNALLKTLEEPPAHVKFIFATTEIHKVLPTIRSRCQQYQFHLFSNETLVEHLKKVISFYNTRYEEKALFWIAKYAYGSMRDALSLLSQVLASNEENIEEKNVLNILGIQPYELVIELFDSVFRKDFQKIFTIAYKIYISGIDINQFSLQMIEFLRGLALVQNNVSNLELLNLSGDQLAQLEKFKNQYNLKQILMMIERIAEFQKNASIYTNIQPYFESLLLSFAFADSFISNSEVIEQIKSTNISLQKIAGLPISKEVKLSREDEGGKDINQTRPVEKQGKKEDENKKPESTDGKIDVTGDRGKNEAGKNKVNPQSILTPDLDKSLKKDVMDDFDINTIVLDEGDKGKKPENKKETESLPSPEESRETISRPVDGGGEKPETSGTMRTNEEKLKKKLKTLQMETKMKIENNEEIPDSFKKLFKYFQGEYAKEETKGEE